VRDRVLARRLLIDFANLILSEIKGLDWRSTVAREDHALY
jgi:hypothetical protein